MFIKANSPAPWSCCGKRTALLQQTDDFVWLGNIQSAYGRVALEEGRYEAAVESFS